MKARTLLELVTLSTTLYTISKETQVLEKLSELGEKGKRKINSLAKERLFDDKGNEVEFVEKMLQKAREAKEDLDVKITGLIEDFYEKINVAHVKQVEVLEQKLAEMNKNLTDTETRLNQLEKNAV
jgi:polyhydroxyalkanoate synthesis regulator phasin